MYRSVALLVLLAACGDNHGAAPGDAGGSPPDSLPGEPPPDAAPTPPDTTPPDTTIAEHPPASATAALAAWVFTGTDLDDRFECSLDSAGFVACSNPLQIQVQDGMHTLQVRAVDRAGNADPTPASFTWTVNTKCGNGTVDPDEQCDGANLGGSSCGTFGFTGGALACTTSCGLDTTACTSTFVTANTGFSGVPCFDGLRFSTPNLTLPYVLACTEDNGVFKTKLDTPLTWTNTTAAGLTAPNGPNLKGHVVATNPNGPPVYYISDATMATNAFRSNTGGDTWAAQSISNAGVQRDVFAFVFRQQVGNIAGSWDAELGAVVMHGNQPTTMVPHFVGAAAGTVTGTVRGIASGGPKDVYVAVYGQTPSGAPATGGIYRACDLTTTGGGSYEERDTGISADDRNRVWSITADPGSITTTPFMCGESTSAGSATTYYAALRGGGQIYKTIDSGVTWKLANTGLPAGLEVYQIAIDCYATTVPEQCRDRARLYAATSGGLYRSLDAGAHWVLDGFAGLAVRALALDPVAAPPHLFVGVDDAVGIYQNQSP